VVIGVGSQDVERKVISILRVLHSAAQPLGARLIAQQLKGYGVELGERAVRYHLKLMDERGLTKPLPGRDGREITALGVAEVNDALVTDKVGLVLERIESLSFSTSFDVEKRNGLVPVNVSLFPRESFSAALKVMKRAFKSGLCVSNLVAVAEGEVKLGDVMVPAGMVGFATVCSLVINGTMLKAGIPIDSRFGGVLQMRDGQPLRFVDLIYYSGSTVDPSEVFIRARMTDVQRVVKEGNGKILANFRELPSQCLPLAEEVTGKLKEAGLGGIIARGNTSESICGITVGLNRIGMILIGGLTPVAAALEAGVDVENKAMSTLIDYCDLVKFESLL